MDTEKQEGIERKKEIARLQAEGDEALQERVRLMHEVKRRELDLLKFKKQALLEGNRLLEVSKENQRQIKEL